METKITRKQITKDWRDSFINLSIYTQSKLLKVNGCIIVGVWIAKLPATDSYRPTFLCYPLWRNNAKSCLEEPMFMFELRNQKNLQFTIPFSKHNDLLEEAIKCSKEQYNLIENDNVIINQLNQIINVKSSDILVKSSPVSQAKLFEAKLMGALYINDMNAINELLEEIQIASKNWRPDLFEWKFGKVEDWLDKLKEIVNDRDDFLKQIELNKQDKKISKLKQFELLP